MKQSITDRRNRCGHTLMEMVVALPLLTMLFAGMAAGIGLARRVAPDASTPAGRTIQAAAAWDLLAQDLRVATSFATLTPGEVVCTVPDRTGDNAPETIRYAWSGTVGTSLIRQCNGGTAEPIATNVQSFTLTYQRRGTTVFNLEGVDVRLQLGDNPATHWDASVAVLNQPVVAGP